MQKTPPRRRSKMRIAWQAPPGTRKRKNTQSSMKMHPVLLEEGSPNAFRVWGGGKVGRKRRGRVFWLVLFVGQARMYMLEDVGHGIVVLMCVVPGWVDVDGEAVLAGEVWLLLAWCWMLVWGAGATSNGAVVLCCCSLLFCISCSNRVEKL